MNKSSFIYQCAFAAMGFLSFAATQANGTAKATNTDYTKYVDPLWAMPIMATPFLERAAPLA